MKSLLLKSAFLLCAYYIFTFAAGCIMCECDDVERYYDYSGITAAANQNIAANQMQLILSWENIDFVAQGLQWNFGNCAYACKCASPGYAGGRYEISHIEIRADHDFNDSLQAGESLNSLFKVRDPFSNQIMEINSQSLRTSVDEGLMLFTEAVPNDTTSRFSFTVEVTKSNGTVLSATSNPVSW